MVPQQLPIPVVQWLASSFTVLTVFLSKQVWKVITKRGRATVISSSLNIEWSDGQGKQLTF